jgi:hypothetical protein
MLLHEKVRIEKIGTKQYLNLFPDTQFQERFQQSKIAQKYTYYRLLSLLTYPERETWNVIEDANAKNIIFCEMIECYFKQHALAEWNAPIYEALAQNQTRVKEFVNELIDSIILTEEEMEKIQNLQNVPNLAGKIVGTCRLVDEIPTTF